MKRWLLRIRSVQVAEGQGFGTPRSATHSDSVEGLGLVIVAGAANRAPGPAHRRFLIAQLLDAESAASSNFFCPSPDAISSVMKGQSAARSRVVRPPRRILGWILLFSFVTRVGWVLHLEASEPGRTWANDTWSYLYPANYFAQAGDFPAGMFTRTPGYPGLLGAVLAIWNSETVFLIVQVCLSCATVLACYYVASRLSGKDDRFGGCRYHCCRAAAVRGIWPPVDRVSVLPRPRRGSGPGFPRLQRQPQEFAHLVRTPRVSTRNRGADPTYLVLPPTLRPCPAWGPCAASTVSTAACRRRCVCHTNRRVARKLAVAKPRRCELVAF